MYIFLYVEGHIWIKHTLALCVKIGKDCFCFQWEDNFGNQDVLIDDGELCTASTKAIYAHARTGLLFDDTPLIV